MPQRSNPRSVQAAICIAAFLVPFMGSSLNLAMPDIAGDFHMSAFALTFIVSMYLVGACVFQMPAARLGDLFGRRRVFLAGLSVFGVFSLASGFAWSGTSLIVFRLFSGIGSALVFATNMAILTAVFPKEQRGKALGVNTAVVYLAVAAGPFLGGLLAHHLGWRAIFYACFVLTLVAVLAAVVSIKDEWREAEGEPYDVSGAAVYVLAISGVVFGFSLLPRWSGWALLAAGFLAVPVFVKMENAARFPMLKLELFFNNRHFRLSSLSAMINYAASFAIGFILSLYLQYVLGMTPDKAGLILIAQPVAQTILSPVAGRISDRVNPSYLTTAGMGLIALGLFALSWLTPASSVAGIVAVLIGVGVGFALFSSPNVNIIMGSVSSRDSGLASATTGTARQIGQSLSMASTSLIVYAYMGSSTLSAETAGDFMPALRTGFLIFSFVSLVGIYTSASKLFGGDEGQSWRHVSARLKAREE